MIETISRDRLIDLLNAGADQRIAIIGDAMLDVYLRGDVDRISPEAPVPVVRVREKELALGGAANDDQDARAGPVAAGRSLRRRGGCGHHWRRCSAAARRSAEGDRQL